MQIAGLHLLILLLAGELFLELRPLGRWIWEQQVLRPRVAAFQRIKSTPSNPGFRPATIEGHPFVACERVPDGTLFYTLLLGGPFVSRGIFVPAGDSWRRPGMIRTLTPTSVPGLFWFVTND